MAPFPVSAATIADHRSTLDDWHGLGDLIAFTTRSLVTPVEGMHRAVASRWIGLAGSRARPVRNMYDDVAVSTYEAVRQVGSSAAVAIVVGAEMIGAGRPLPPLWNTSGGSHVQSVVNALWGDKFDDEQSSFSIEMNVRDGDGAAVPPEPDALGRAFPSPRNRLVVLLHGLGETERCWYQESGESLTEVLEADGFSVLPMRYNSGRRVSANGSDLADLLEEIVMAWPVEVEGLALVGHSMGGLVARSAVAAAQRSRQSWVALTHHLVCIGTPHLGTPIEKAVHLAAAGLDHFGETRPLGAFIGERSEGIKELRHGPVIEEDRTGGIQQLFVAGAVTTEVGRPMASLLGDLVVRIDSATGAGRQRRVQATRTMVVGGRNHAALIRDADVHGAIKNWLMT